MVKPGRAMPENSGSRARTILSRTAMFCTSASPPDTSTYSLFAWSLPTILAEVELYSAECASYVLTVYTSMEMRRARCIGILGAVHRRGAAPLPAGGLGNGRGGGSGGGLPGVR